MNTLCMTLVRAIGALVVLAGVNTALAQDAGGDSDPHEALKQLMQKNSCTACHFVDKRKYGPHFLEMSQKYEKADQATLDKLVVKMRSGGAGVWGEDPMPPQPQLSEAEAQKMLQLILALQAKGK